VVRNTVLVAAMLMVAGCSRSFQAPGAEQLTISLQSIAPAVATDGTDVVIKFSANQLLQTCSAQLGSFSALCDNDSATSCSCHLTVLSVLPEGQASVSVTGTTANGSASASGTVEIDRTPPTIGAGGFSLVRNPLGTVDQIAIAADAVADTSLSGAAYKDQRVVAINLWDTADLNETMPIASIDGGGPAKADIGDINQSYPHVWISAVDVPGNKSARVPVLIGDDVAGPSIDRNALVLNRKPLGAPDEVEISRAAWIPDAGCGPAAYRLYASDDGGSQIAPDIAIVDDAGATATVGDGNSSLPSVWISALDKCQQEGPRVQAQGVDESGPSVDGLLLTWHRRPWGTVETLSGDNASIVDLPSDGGSAIREVRVYDGPPD
jgi:hypothetical protein